VSDDTGVRGLRPLLTTPKDMHLRIFQAPAADCSRAVQRLWALTIPFRADCWTWNERDPYSDASARA